MAFNISLSKNFAITEHSRLQFRWETFHFTNHTNLSLPNVNLDKANAGTITDNKPPRIMQLGLRYSF